MKATSTPMRWLAAAAAALFAVGCAQSNGDLNRVQPNVMKKEDLLDGQWFFRNSVSYTPFNTQFTYPGQTGNMEKLVWEIQERNLVGYRSYPSILGAESNIDSSSKISGTTATYCNKAGECKGGQQYFGAPVVAFSIESHFDIQRGYNPATGEQTNVISENSSDRVWNQREFIRVNWAANMLNKNSGLSWGTIQNAAGGSSTSNWIQPNEKGEDSYDWPTYEYDAKGKLNYFDVTARYMANPDTTYYEGYGDIPLCWFANGIYDCSSAEIKIRTSIMKVDTNWSRDYEPLQYGNDLMSMFGFFRTERLNWDKKYGLNDSAVIRLAQRHRVYESYYKKDAAGEVDTTQPIPPAERKSKPVVYYFSRADRMGGEERYAEFWEPGRQVEADYNRAFSRAIAAAQGKAIGDVPQMFFLCNNPVKAGDNAACGKAGFSPKFGDLRYSFVNTVAEPVANGLLGYGPSSADPETGQLISGNSNTYLWGVDLIARELVDQILLLNNEKTATEYISGDDMKEYLAANPVYNIRAIQQQTAPLQSELQGIPQRNEESKGAWSRPAARMSDLVQGLRASGGLPVSTRNEMKAAADELAKHPQLEAAVLDNAEMQADLVNLLPPYAQERAKNDPTFLRQVSRSVLTDITASQQYNKRRLDWLSKNNITMAEFYDRTLMGDANEQQNVRQERIAAYKSGGSPKCANTSACTDAEAKTLANDDIAKKFRQEIWSATTAHELGHTFNLRHNFQGSFDSVNYFDQFWEIKKPTLTMKQNQIDKLPRTPNDLKAAADGTAAQLAQKMYSYEYSSIMDYSGKRTGDWQGIGKYDEAAIIFAYSGTTEPGYVEVFKGARKDSKQFPGTDGANVTVSGAGGDLPMVNATATNPNVFNYTERFHYSTVPLHFGEGADTAAIINDGISKLKNREMAKWSDVKKDEDRVREALKADPTLIGDADRAAAQLGNVRLRVPYMFCSDESADGPVQSCYRFDRGPDYYEQTRTYLEDYWNYYYDTHFRRDKAFFSGNSAINSAFGTFYNVANSYKHWVYRFYKQGTSEQEITTNAKIDATMQDYWTMAVLDGVNQHLNVMSVPPYGLFMLRTQLTGGARWDMISEGVDFEDLSAAGRAELEAFYRSRYSAKDFVLLPRGQGRRMYSRYDFKSGFGFFNRMSEAGHYNDQLGAMFAAVLPDFNVQGVDVQADQNRYSIPYYQVFRKEFTKTFGALWSQDEKEVRPFMYRTVDNAGGLTTVPALARQRFVSGSNLFQGFDYPKAPPTICSGGNTTNCVKGTQNLAPANIQVTYTSRIYALYLGEALFKANYDLDYSKVNQVVKVGGNESFTVAPGYEAVEVEDIVTGARYAAFQTVGAAQDSTPAVRAVRTTNIYLNMVRNPALCPLDDYLTILGYTCLDAAQANNPAILEERRKFWLESYQDSIRDLDLMRDFYRAFGKAF